MGRPRHPNSHIEKAIQHAESLGWRVVTSKGHAWGRMFCPWSTREGCLISVWSTPKVPENHARHVRNKVDSCPHRDGSGQGEEAEDEK